MKRADFLGIIGVMTILIMILITPASEKGIEEEAPIEKLQMEVARLNERVVVLEAKVETLNQPSEVDQLLMEVLIMMDDSLKQTEEDNS